MDIVELAQTIVRLRKSISDDQQKLAGFEKQMMLAVANVEPVPPPSEQLDKYFAANQPEQGGGAREQAAAASTHQASAVLRSEEHRQSVRIDRRKPAVRFGHPFATAQGRRDRSRRPRDLQVG